MAVKYLEIYTISIILKFTRSLLKSYGSEIISNIFSTGPDKSVSKLVELVGENIERVSSESLFEAAVVSSLKDALKPPGYETLKSITRIPGGIRKLLSKLSDRMGGDTAGEAAGETAGEAAAEAVGEAAAADASAGGPLNIVADIFALVYLVVSISGILVTILTLDFAAPELIMHEFSDSAAGCITIQSMDNIGKNNPCSNGYYDHDNKKCVPCNQIDKMRDWEDPGQYINSYKNSDKITEENVNQSYAADLGKDPSTVHKLTSLTCFPPSSSDDPGPTYADRPYPAGYCHRIRNVNSDTDSSNLDNESADIFEDEYNSYLTNDGNMCNVATRYDHPRPRDVIDKTVIAENTGKSAKIKDLITAMDGTKTVKWNFETLDWTRNLNDDDDDSQVGCDGVLSCDWNNQGYVANKYYRFTDTLDYYTTTKGSYEKPIQPVDLSITVGSEEKKKRPNIKVYNNSNVCSSPYEMAGDSMYFRKNNREFDNSYIKNKNKMMHFSNYCCPKIENGKQCPKWNDNKPLTVTYKTKKEDFNGHLDTRSEPNTKNCYVLDKPEFISERMRNADINQDYNSNEDFSTIRSGSIQCGPKNIEISSPIYNRGNQHKDHETHVEGNLVKPIKPSNTEYYGTRFKLDSRYNYFSESDSGATGYENYLDPFDYIPLKNETEDGEITKYITTSNINYQYFDISNRNTTITDVIAKEQGHPDRVNLFCNNMKCNDLEKTKYMQSVYDVFCKIPGSNMSSPAIDTKHNKFYRPGWIKTQPENLTSSPYLYSDICCDPIDYSRQTSFIGCDSKGKNPYFIDQIIQDYNNNSEPTLPKNDVGVRKRINPLINEKHNLNQCIPSIEVKCTLSRDYYNRLSSSPSDEQVIQSIEDNKKCNNLLNILALNKNNLNSDNLENYFKDKSLQKICEDNSNNMCTAYTPNMIYDKSIYNSKDYWLLDRLSVGYAPEKGWLDNSKDIRDDQWNETPNNGLNNYIINKPSLDVYTECNPITPCSNIYDLEIYDKRIDSLKIPNTNRNGYPTEEKDTSNKLKDSCTGTNNYHTIRYIGSDEPPNRNELIGNFIDIKCRNYEDRTGKNYSNIPNIIGPYSDSTLSNQIDHSINNVYYYNIGCVSSPSSDDGKEIINVH